MYEEVIREPADELKGWPDKQRLMHQEHKRACAAYHDLTFIANDLNNLYTSMLEDDVSIQFSAKEIEAIKIQVNVLRRILLNAFVPDLKTQFPGFVKHLPTRLPKDRRKDSIHIQCEVSERENSFSVDDD